MICKKCRQVLMDSFSFCPFCGAETRPAPKPKQKRRPKGSGCITKLPGNRSEPYQARKNNIALGTFATWEEANAFLANLGSADPALKNLTLADIYLRYQASQAYTGLTRDSQKNMQLAWSKMTEISKMRARDIKTAHFKSCIDRAAEAGTGRDGCAKIRTLASLLCQNAMEDDIMDRNYAKGLRLPEPKDTAKKRNFTDEEIIQLFYAADDRDARIVLCLIYTGMRIDELFSVKKSDVDIADHYMTGGEKTEAGRNRTIPIRDEIIPYIVQFLNEPGEYLVSSPRGKKTNPDNWRGRNFYSLLERLGFDFKDEQGRNVITPHRARHTYISEAISAGVRPEALTKIVGHASYETSVDKYDDVVNLDFLQREAKKGL